jgi:DNA polymerase III delta prime subunit
MNISQLAPYVVKHYFSPRRDERKYGLLVLGPPGCGKSTAILEGAKAIAKEMNREFLKIVVRWSPAKQKFVIDSADGDSIEQILKKPDKYFFLTDFRLSAIEPSDLTGIPRSFQNMTFYEPQRTQTLFPASQTKTNGQGKGLVFGESCGRVCTLLRRASSLQTKGI